VLLLLKPRLFYLSGFYLYYRHTPTYKEVAQPLFVYPLLEILPFILPFSFSLWSLINVVRQIRRLFTNKNFLYSIFFFNFHYLTHSVSTFCLPKNLLFEYPYGHEYPFCLLRYKIILVLYYRCIVLKVLLGYLLKTTFYLHPRITSCLFLWLTSTAIAGC
jgi:hypothetical protein